MFTSKLNNLRVITASGLLLSAVLVKESKIEHGMKKIELADQHSHYKRKRSELPLYSPLHSRAKPVELSFKHEHKTSQSKIRSNVEDAVRVVRQQVQSGLHIVDKQKESVLDLIATAKSHSLSAVDYLNQPHNALPRTGAIAIGGIAGFVFAARGGFIKKVLYTTIGAGGIASLCYPEKASVIARDSLYEARKGYAIAYNFVKGVKPGDEIPVEPINKFPTSLEDLKFMLWDLYDETVETLFPKNK